MTKYPGRTAILCGLAVVVGGALFYFICAQCPWICDKLPGEGGIRNIIIILGGIGAFYGLYVRTEGLKHEKKTKAEESISRAVKQMDSKSLPTRRVGVRLLQRIVEENSENEEIITDILMEFVKNKCGTNEFYGGMPEEEESDPFHVDFVDDLAERKCIDIETALRTLGEIVPSEKREKVKFEHLSLKALVLDGVNFSKFSFKHVNLNGSILRKADLRESEFKRCAMHCMDLSNAKLQWASFLTTGLNDVNFNGAIFEKTDCSHSSFFSNSIFDDHSDDVPKSTMEKAQTNEMIYYEKEPPEFSKGWKLPKTNAYKKEGKDSRGKDRRRFIESGKWIGPA